MIPFHLGARQTRQGCWDIHDSKGYIAAPVLPHFRDPQDCTGCVANMIQPYFEGPRDSMDYVATLTPLPTDEQVSDVLCACLHTAITQLSIEGQGGAFNSGSKKAGGKVVGWHLLAGTNRLEGRWGCVG